MANNNEKLMETTIIPGRGGIYGKGSSGEGALDYSPGDNEDSEGGSSGSGWRGGNPQRSQGSTGPGNKGHALSKRDGGMSGYAAGADDDDPDGPNYGGSTGFRAVQAPNRPK